MLSTGQTTNKQLNGGLGIWAPGRATQEEAAAGRLAAQKLQSRASGLTQEQWDRHKKQVRERGGRIKAQMQWQPLRRAVQGAEQKNVIFCWCSDIC